MKDGELFQKMLYNDYGFECKSERGAMSLVKDDRKISVRIGFPGIDPIYLEGIIKKNNEFISFCNSFNLTYQKKKVFYKFKLVMYIIIYRLF